MNVIPVTLSGKIVRLEPLALSHASALLAASDPGIFAFMFLRPHAQTVEAFEEYVRQSIGQSDRRAFVTVLRATDEVVGTTSYMNIRALDRGLEIGSTWIGRRHQGTLINVDSKYVLLRHAFEVLQAVRVELRCDSRNRQSQRGIEKLGARREGTLRKHIVMPDGYIRDTVLYSITDDDWTQVRGQLAARLAGSPSL
ncbi:MAG: GNAT family protein [Chloroflexota bacterium]